MTVYLLIEMLQAFVDLLCSKPSYVRSINPLGARIFFKILAHPVFKM